MNLTVLIITKNAGDTLEKTLQSVDKWAHRIVVVDDYSTDATKRIARDYGCDVVIYHADTFGEQRAFALTQVNTEWTLVLDSDEVLTSQNRQEIEKAVQTSAYDGYYLRFRNHLFGKKLLHRELHKKLVLFKTKQAYISAKEVHEQYEVKGVMGELPSEVLHYSYRSFLQIIVKFLDYSWRQAREYKRMHKKYGARELFLNPIHMFYARYIADQGYKDGIVRIFLDKAFSAMEFFSYAFIPFVKTKKRISVDCGSYAVGGGVKSGIERLLQGIYSHASPDYDYFWFSFAEASHQKLPTRFYAELWLPLRTLLCRCDLFFGTAGTIPAILGMFPIKKVLFLHDFGFFSSPEKYGASAKRLQIQTENSIRRADNIVVFHKEIYKEFAIRYPQYCHKVVVITAGADHLNTLLEQPVFIQEKKPLILYVGVVKPIKRIDKLLSVIGDTYCIIAGPQEQEYRKSLHIGETQNVQFIQNFSDGQLKWLYTHADVMVYTSEQEGFCYPVLEALTLGVPVIAFDLPLFHEYQKQFPHLMLVKTEEEMKEKLKKIDNRVPVSPKNYSYTWEAFNERLVALWQPRSLPAGRQGYRRPNEKKEKKVGIIVVLYQTPDEEKRKLEQEIKKIGFSSCVVYWIDNSKNGKGYAAGINEGIRKALIDDCDFFIVLNPDISLQSISAEAIFAVAHEFDVWGFGMRQNGIIYYGGEIDKWRLSGGLISQKLQVRYPAVDFVSGSFIGFSREVVQRIGFWDEGYFMYYEDVDYCIRAQRAGLGVGIDSGAIYEHFEVSRSNEKKKKWIGASRWRFFWKYADVKQKMREIIRLPKTLFIK